MRIKRINIKRDQPRTIVIEQESGTKIPDTGKVRVFRDYFKKTDSAEFRS